MKFRQLYWPFSESSEISLSNEIAKKDLNEVIIIRQIGIEHPQTISQWFFSQEKIQNKIKILLSLEEKDQSNNLLTSLVKPMITEKDILEWENLSIPVDSSGTKDLIIKNNNFNKYTIINIGYD